MAIIEWPQRHSPRRSHYRNSSVSRGARRKRIAVYWMRLNRCWHHGFAAHSERSQNMVVRIHFH
jgi:hypothetical protein